jgi:hypothetical protein
MFRLSDRSSSALVSITIVACLVFTVPTLAAGQTATDKPEHRLSRQDWREDLRFLAAQMRLKHESLFHTMTVWVTGYFPQRESLKRSSFSR